VKTVDLFTENDLSEAVEDLAMLPFFPAESRAAVMTLLRKMCPHRTALRWLVAEAVNHVAKWPGPAELRGILCSHYDAADGIDQWSSLPGYRAEDAEMKHLEAHEQIQANQDIRGESREILKRLTDGVKLLAPPRSAKGAA
jgi:hypothetical protein